MLGNFIVILLGILQCEGRMHHKNDGKFSAAASGLNNTSLAYRVSDIPGVNFSMPPSWAGAIPIPNKGDDHIFFWLFEAERGGDEDALIIWLNGGPGCSSLTGLTQEIGPLSFSANDTFPRGNEFSWTQLANVLFIDQPVGTGYSFGNDGADDNDEVTDTFVTLLIELSKTFPGLLTKNVHLMGESYAGTYIPYFADSILRKREAREINLRSISIGNPTIGNIAAMSDAVVTSYLRQRDSILKLPRQILGVFDGADKSCGFDRVISQIQYPPQGKIYIEGNPEGENFRHRREEASCGVPATTASQLQRSINGPCYGECATFSAADDYLNAVKQCFNNYNVATTCANRPNNRNAVKWLNDPAIRKAIHAYRSQKAYEACNATIQATLTKELVQPPAYFILPRILQQIPVHVYSGDLDFMVNHIGTELVIQNMTWNGKQGLQCEPLTPFIVRGRQVGTWGSERGLSYYLFHGAGHAVPHDAPEAAFAFVRDFVLQDKV